MPTADLTTALAGTTGVITAMGALGTAAFGLVDATKAFNGGISNCGWWHVKRALAPFKPALDNASTDWKHMIRAGWINGMSKDDQKAQAKSLIRLGLNSANAAQLATPGHVDPTTLAAIVQKIETGVALAPNEVDLLGRFNGYVDVAMEGGFERADQTYRNASRFWAGVIAIGLANWAGVLLAHAKVIPPMSSLDLVGMCTMVGLFSVPIAPIAKDIASALQAAGSAVKAAAP